MVQLSPQVGQFLDSRFQSQVQALAEHAQSANRQLDKDPIRALSVWFDPEQPNVVFACNSIIPLGLCSLEIATLLLIRWRDYLLIRGMFYDLVRWGEQISAQYQQRDLLPPLMLCISIHIGYCALMALQDRDAD